MGEAVLLDTGPLVALLSSGDQHHEICKDELRRLTRRPITCWPVLTEAAWLLRARLDAVELLLANLDQGLVEVADLPRESGRWLASFIRRYHDIGCQLADAALMYLAESRGIATIFTLDRRDFTVYRTSDGRALTIVPST